MNSNGATLRLDGVSIRVGECQALDDVTFHTVPGEWVLLAGPSGAGKSTLLRCANGLQTPDHGSIETLGTRIPGRTGRQARAVWQRTGTVLQEIALFETKSARGNVELGLRSSGMDRASARHEALGWLDRLEIGHKAEDHPWRLSGGERQRVALARAFAPRPRLLLLDEPTSALDGSTAQVVLEAIDELVGGGTTVVMSSHREDEITSVCHRRIELRKGEIVDDTTLRLHVVEAPIERAVG